MKMKRQTKVSDLQRLLDGDESLKRIPLARRAAAEEARKLGILLARSAAAEGGSYSGTTCIEACFGATCIAETRTSWGPRYSRRVTFHKTNANHVVHVTADGVIDLVGEDALIKLSERELLPLVGYRKDTGAAEWVRGSGKRIALERGFLAYDESGCFHSTKSLAHAQKGLDKKREIKEQAIKRASAERKETRRARLVARLCCGVSATLEDAKALGFCSPGIRAFQAKFGIGDTSSLPDLIRTGDPSAIRLALSVARGVYRVVKPTK
jgi:hypothetical protein